MAELYISVEACDAVRSVRCTPTLRRKFLPIHTPKDTASHSGTRYSKYKNPNQGKTDGL